MTSYFVRENGKITLEANENGGSASIGDGIPRCLSIKGADTVRPFPGIPMEFQDFGSCGVDTFNTKPRTFFLFIV